MQNIGYFVLTVPPEVRHRLRDPLELSSLGKAVTRLFKRRGFNRGMRRWHWFGERENGVSGIPVFNPHLNVLVDGAFLESERIQSIQSGWTRIMRWRYGFRGTVVSHYSYAVTPGQMYHRVRYVTRATFCDARWDGQAALMLTGFRNASTWGKWGKAKLWEPESADAAPAESQVRATVGLCPGDHKGQSILLDWKKGVVLPASRFRDWPEIGSGYYCSDTRLLPNGQPP